MQLRMLSSANRAALQHAEELSSALEKAAASATARRAVPGRHAEASAGMRRAAACGCAPEGASNVATSAKYLRTLARLAASPKKSIEETGAIYS